MTEERENKLLKYIDELGNQIENLQKTSNEQENLIEKMKRTLDLTETKGAEYINETLDLRKANAELKEKCEALQSGKDVCWQGDMDKTIKICLEQRNEIEKLKAQIEKMKCCSNCDNGLRNGLLCDRQIECRKNNNKLWELAE